MKYVIIGSGQIGTALARIFARKNVEVGRTWKARSGRSAPSCRCRPARWASVPESRQASLIEWGCLWPASSLPSAKSGSIVFLDRAW
jgi:predicted dinucleotide-binding enzyme